MNYEFDVVFGWGEEKEDEKCGKEKGEGKVFFLYLVGAQKWRKENEGGRSFTLESTIFFF